VVVEEGEVGAPEGLLVRGQPGLFEEELFVQHGARVLDRIMAGFPRFSRGDKVTG
jgi:hypothetical protein